MDLEDIHSLFTRFHCIALSTPHLKHPICPFLSFTPIVPGQDRPKRVWERGTVVVYLSWPAWPPLFNASPLGSSTLLCCSQDNNPISFGSSQTSRGLWRLSINQLVNAPHEMLRKEQKWDIKQTANIKDFSPQGVIVGKKCSV